MNMTITTTSVLVDDQARALEFHTNTITFVKSADTPEYDRLSALGARFAQPPMAIGPVITAVLDDTCGNLIQIASMP